MDATDALFTASLLLLVGVYGIYWLESRKHSRGSRSARSTVIRVVTEPRSPTDDSAA